MRNIAVPFSHNKRHKLHEWDKCQAKYSKDTQKYDKVRNGFIEKGAINAHQTSDKLNNVIKERCTILSDIQFFNY